MRRTRRPIPVRPRARKLRRRPQQQRKRPLSSRAKHRPGRARTERRARPLGESRARRSRRKRLESAKGLHQEREGMPVLRRHQVQRRAHLPLPQHRPLGLLPPPLLLGTPLGLLRVARVLSLVSPPVSSRLPSAVWASSASLAGSARKTKTRRKTRTRKRTALPPRPPPQRPLQKRLLHPSRRRRSVSAVRVVAVLLLPYCSATRPLRRY